MKAVILAGGEGSRLRPLTCDLPKPMVPIMNFPIMEHIIYLLRAHGITEIAVTLMYMPQRIMDYFGNGSSFGVKLKYYTENEPLGTAGSVKNAADFLNETFIVISGDVLTDINLTDAILHHKNKQAMASLVLTHVDVPLDYGVVVTDNCGAVVDFLEKPSWGEVFSDTINTGIYILEPEVLKFIPENTKSDFSKDVFPSMLSNHKALYGYNTNSYWTDIGDLTAYKQAHIDILENKIKLRIKGKKKGEKIWVGKGSTIEPGAQINEPCVIGSNCIVRNGATIDSMCVLGNNNVIKGQASIKRSIIWNNCILDYRSELRGAILGNKVHLKDNVSCYENSVVGDNCIINERVIVKPNIKIWPEKTIESFSIIDRNLIWGSKGIQSLFGKSGLTGIINIDITPEYATRLGAAYGSILGKDKRVVVSSSTANSAIMFKHAFISGLLSVGIEVFNLSNILTPIARQAIAFLLVNGGIHIKTCDQNPNQLVVDFMDSSGANVERAVERKIQNAFQKEDFKRCTIDEINRLNNITDFAAHYTDTLIKRLDVSIMNNRSPKLCIISPSGFVLSLVVPIISKAGCKITKFFSAKLEDIDEIKKEIKTSDCDFAAYIDGNGESLSLIEKNGNIISGDLYILLISYMLFKSSPQQQVVVPISTTWAVEKLAKKYSGSVLRTKSYSSMIMKEMLQQNPYSSLEKYTQFMLQYDAITGLVKVIEFLGSNNIDLRVIINHLPKFYMEQGEVLCPWSAKGKVMRLLITSKLDNKESALENKIELLDGIKLIYEDGWLLILPDSDLPVFKLFSEGNSRKKATSLLQRGRELVESYISQFK